MLMAQLVGIGIVISFLFTELTGLSAGGLIVPGYLAFFWSSPSRLAVTLVSALLTSLIVRLLSRFLIIFGRRRFMLSVLTGYLLGGAIFSLSRLFPLESDLRVIGYVVPGLIANDMLKQGVLKTVVSVLLVTLFLHLILLILV